MKWVFVFFAFLLSLTSFSQAEQEIFVDIPGFPLKVSSLEVDFGVIKQFDKQKVKFIILNDTIQPFIIKDVTTSCGCTSSSFTKKPITKGKEGFVKLEFDAARIGTFNKSAFVYNNFAFKAIELKIKGQVVPQKAENISKKKTTIKASADI